MNISKLQSKIEESMAQQQNWNDSSVGYTNGTTSQNFDLNDVRKSSVTEDEETNNLAERLAQGITRQGGNY